MLPRTKLTTYSDMITSVSRWWSALSANHLSNSINRTCWNVNPKISSCVQTKLTSFAWTWVRRPHHRLEGYHQWAAKLPRQKCLRCKTQALSVLQLLGSQWARAWNHSQQLNNTGFPKAIFIKSSQTWQLRTFRMICETLLFGVVVNNKLHLRRGKAEKISSLLPSTIET